jgi:(1->4)-alpha-D-glucan 1-alpha-D-glucosylmutase
VRAQRYDLFTTGTYSPLAADGEKASHIIGFTRGEEAVTLVPRLVLGTGDWKETAVVLPEGRWRNVFSGETSAGRTDVSEIFGIFPVALLIKE